MTSPFRKQESFVFAWNAPDKNIFKKRKRNHELSCHRLELALRITISV